MPETAVADVVIDGWARRFGTQRKFHYFRETKAGQTWVRSECGKWSLNRNQLAYLAPLQPYQPGALHIAPGDCLACSRKVRANEGSGQP